MELNARHVPVCDGGGKLRAVFGRRNDGIVALRAVIRMNKINEIAAFDVSEKRVFLYFQRVPADVRYRQVFRYPQIETRSLLVDAASMFMVRDPGRYDVVVCSNLFGDILTDLGAAIAGGMGLSAGANINPEGRYPSMFEPVHGSAPDIMGQEKANPMATVWAASQMMDHFGRPDLGKQMLDAVEAVLEEGKYLTPDIGGSAKTSEVTRAILEKL